MSETGASAGNNIDTNAQLARSAAAERRLLKQERKAERRLQDAREQLAKDERRLQRAQERFERSARVVTDAEVALRACQARRAAGPPSLPE